jgi:hypothetical protein
MSSFDGPLHNVRRVWVKLSMTFTMNARKFRRGKIRGNAAGPQP